MGLQNQYFSFFPASGKHKIWSVLGSVRYIDIAINAVVQLTYTLGTFVQ
jgi:hypothetical protein